MVLAASTTAATIQRMPYSCAPAEELVVVMGAVSMMAFWSEVESEPFSKASHTVFVTNAVRYVHCTCGAVLRSSVIAALLCRTRRSVTREDIEPPPLHS